jgi:hypothetical protein
MTNNILRTAAHHPPQPASRNQSTLALLVTGIRGADHVDPPLPANNLATFTNALDAGSNLHI